MSGVRMTIHFVCKIEIQDEIWKSFTWLSNKLSTVPRALMITTNYNETNPVND